MSHCHVVLSENENDTCNLETRVSHSQNKSVSLHVTLDIYSIWFVESATYLDYVTYDSLEVLNNCLNNVVAVEWWGRIFYAENPYASVPTDFPDVKFKT